MEHISKYLDKYKDEMDRIDATTNIINYLYKDELKSYEESNEEEKKKHIFNSIQTLHKLNSEQRAKLLSKLFNQK